MSIATVDYLDFDLQTLTETARSVFRGKNAFMGSTLVSSGAVKVNSSMPAQGQATIGTEIRMPYFGSLPGFVNNPDGSAISSVTAIRASSETATVARSSMAVDVSIWAQGNAADVDPYEESVRLMMEQAERRMDELIS